MGLLTGNKFNPSGGLSKNDNGTLRVGNRLPADLAPKGERVGDLWYDTSVLSLKVWNGGAWVGVASGSPPILDAGVELYQAGSTPFIDFHRAANPAGDSFADFNVRLINDTNNALRLSTASAANSTTGGLFRIGNAYIGSHPVHGVTDWAGYGHTNREGANDYNYLCNANGETLINCGGTLPRIRMFISGANERMLIDNDATHMSGRLAMRDNVFYLRAWNDSNHRIEYQGGGVDATVHTMNSNIRFASTSQYVVQITTGGEVIARLQDGNSKTRLGSWAADGQYGGLFNQARMDGNGGHYMHMASNNQNDSYIGCNTAGLGNVYFRLANNGSGVASFGNTNGGLAANQNICLALPNGIAGNTVNWAGSNQIGYNVSSRVHKEEIRTLKHTPEKDSGEDSPIFKLRPVRFKWKRRDAENKTGLVNADEINERHPNGVIGLISEEVLLVAPDCVYIKPAKPEWHHDPEKDPMPEWDADGNPIIYRPAEPEEVQSIDNDRLAGYLVDAIQHIKDSHDGHKEMINAMKEEIKALKAKVK